MTHTEIAQWIENNSVLCKPVSYSMPPNGKSLIALMTVGRFKIPTSIESVEMWDFFQRTKRPNRLVTYYYVPLEFAQEHMLNQGRAGSDAADKLIKTIFE